ncbi:hypothetical protein [Virgibacillus salexigens]|uniref:hypothetical protein n=1 Tax=Virgibacillus salexigens TaxID=61016 RepID=UPI00190A7D81|nr:hypothetical protein [Virgibacillus salexigens]
MKLPSFLVIFLMSIILIGCSNEDSDESKSGEQSNSTLIKNHKFNLEDKGTFYRHSKVNNIGKYETGPVSITLESAEIVSGKYNEKYDYEDVNPEGEKMINFQARFELTQEIEDITFNQEYMHLLLDSEEMSEQPLELRSSAIDIPIIRNYNNTRQITFAIKETNLQDIEKATLIIDSPVDSSGEPLGEDLEIEVDFSKSNN